MEVYCEAFLVARGPTHQVRSRCRQKWSGFLELASWILCQLTIPQSKFTQSSYWYTILEHSRLLPSLLLRSQQSSLSWRMYTRLLLRQYCLTLCLTSLRQLKVCRWLVCVGIELIRMICDSFRYIYSFTYPGSLVHASLRCDYLYYSSSSSEEVQKSLGFVHRSNRSRNEAHIPENKAVGYLGQINSINWWPTYSQI